LGPGSRLIKKGFTGPRSHKGWETLLYTRMQMTLTHDVTSSGLLNISGDSERTLCLRNIHPSYTASRPWWLQSSRSPQWDRQFHMSSTDMSSPSQHSGYYMYHQFNIHNSTFCPHSVFMCFVWIWEQTANISLYKSNWLVFRHVRKIAKSENYLSRVCPSVHLHGTTGRIYIKFNIHRYFENLKKIQF
jgi:hypothetical protein